LPTRSFAGRLTGTCFASAAYVTALLAFPAVAAEVPSQLARAEDPAIQEGRNPVNPWGQGSNSPVIDDIDRPTAPGAAEPPVSIQPVQDRLVQKLVHWVLLMDDERDQSFAEITRFVSANTAWPKRSSLIRKAERAIDDATPDRLILEWFNNRTPGTLEGAVAWTRALARSGQDRRAMEVARRSWVRFDFDKDEEQDYLREFGRYLEPEDHAARLDRLLWDNRRSAATRHKQLLGEGRRMLADARLRLMAQRRGVDAAIERVPGWLENDPGLYYERVRWRRRKEMNKEAAELLLGFRGDMVRASRWWTEREILARRLLRDGDPKTAYKLVRNHGLTGGVKRADAEFLAGWIALRYLDDPYAAFSHFSALYDFVSYPISRARGAYWTGRAAEAAGKSEISAQWYRVASAHNTTFYGQLAADRLGIGVAPPAGREIRIDPVEAENFERDDLVRLVRLMIGLRKTAMPEDNADTEIDPARSPMAFLASLDDDEALVPFLRHIAWRGKSATHWVKAAQLAKDAGRAEIAVYIARRAAQDGVMLRDLGYPTMVVEGDLPLDPALLHALIRQESAFDPEAHSRAGARGLMQLMPATAKKIARDLEIKGHSTNRLTEDPYHNLTLGSAYLNDMLSRYEGSMVMALAAYNAGPHRVKRWLEENGDPRRSLDDAIDWIEAIPFSETRNYVQRILETLPIYRWKLDHSKLVLLRPEDLTRGLPGYDRLEEGE
jgi:soluble lytic murein transglycosylase